MVAALRRGSHPPRIAPPSLRMPRETVTPETVGRFLCLAEQLQARGESAPAPMKSVNPKGDRRDGR